MTRLRRTSNETSVAITCTVGDSQPGSINTTDAFFDHMLVTFARYSGIRLDIEAAGDLQHHLLEDVAIALGLALRDEVPAHCARYGYAMIPMDEALVEVVVDEVRELVQVVGDADQGATAAPPRAQEAVQRALDGRGLQQHEKSERRQLLPARKPIRPHHLVAVGDKRDADAAGVCQQTSVVGLNRVGLDGVGRTRR